jgi:cytochrome bd ubiquinol oxidase subunit II
MIALANVWYLVIGLLLVGYAVLDGFDLGVGMLAPFVGRTPAERTLLMQTIGPFWDGNEVWLLTLGGALFAAFPVVYATVFSGFYLALMLLLLGLIMRAVAMEFRHQVEAARWLRAWDWVWWLGSLLPALLLGVALGNVARGLPLEGGNYTGGLLGLLNPFSLLVGVTGVAMFAMQGAAWLVLRTSGEIQARARRAGRYAWLAFATLWVLMTVYALVDAPHLWSNYGQPVLWLVPAAFLAALGLTGWAFFRGSSDRQPIVSSSLTIVALIAILGQALYPALLPDRNASADLTVFNAASSNTSLTVMLVIALIGMPLVLAYTAFVYRRFTHKIESTESAYG